MKRLASLAAALTLLSVAVFDVGKEASERLGSGPVIILLLFGLVMWALLSRTSSPKSDKGSGLPINLALWLHSGFEGILGALSFSFGLRAGLIVCSALFIHLLPEGLAMTAVLRQDGFSYHYAVRTYLISVAILVISFGLFNTLPLVNPTLLVSLSTVVAGGFIYLAVNTTRKVFQTS